MALLYSVMIRFTRRKTRRIELKYPAMEAGESTRVRTVGAYSGLRRLDKLIYDVHVRSTSGCKGPDCAREFLHPTLATEIFRVNLPLSHRY